MITARMVRRFNQLMRKARQLEAQGQLRKASRIRREAARLVIER